MSEKSLVWKVVQLEQEVERLREALGKIANTPQLKGCCNKWEHCDCLDIANNIAREALKEEV